MPQQRPGRVLTKRVHVAGRFLVDGRDKGALLGRGQFSDVYRCSDVQTTEEHAIKVEVDPERKTLLRLERTLLEELEKAGMVAAPRLIDAGYDEENNVEYLVMTLMGESLYEKRRAMGVFTLPTMRALAVKMIDALEGMHTAGYVHRDVKAANFVLDSNSSRKPCLVDFGLAKLWIDRETGKARKPSTRADFRGSASWASANAYTGRELGRHDDLWSLLYVLVDFVAGTLPWKELVDHHNPKGPSDDRRGTVEKEKNRCRKDPSTLIAAVPEGEAQPVGPLGRTPAVKVPSEIAEMSRYLDTLEFDDTPDYDKLRKMFSAKLPVPADAVLLDWEQGAEQQRARWEGSNNGTYAGAVTGGAQMPGANGHHAQPQPQGHGQPGHASQGHAQHGQRLRELPKLSPAAEAFIGNANKYTAKYNDMMLSSDPRVKWFGHTGKSAMEGIGVLANDYGDDVDVLKSVHTQLRQLTADLGAISEEMDMWLRGAHGGVSLGMRPHVAEASRQAAHAAMVGHGHHGPSPGSHPNADARRRDERAHAYDRRGPSNRRNESRHGGAGHGGGDEWRREGGRSGGQQRQYGPNGPGGYSDRDHDYDGRRDDREYYRERERSSWYDDRDRHRERERDERMRSSSHPHSRGQGSGHSGGRSRGSGGGRR